MEVKELVDFMKRTVGEGRYKHTSNFSEKEEKFAQMIKLVKNMENYASKFHEFCEHKE